MKILAVVGSSKVNGNTDKLVDSFIRGAEESGHEIVKVHLGKTVIHPCLGCNACKTTGNCVQKDGFEELLTAFQECDVIALSTPLYFWSISAQLKAVIDRLYCIGEKDPKGYYFLYPKKKSVLLATAADSPRHFWAFDLVEEFYRRLVKYMRWTDLGTVFAYACGGSGVMERCIENTPYLERAYELGKKL